MSAGNTSVTAEIERTGSCTAVTEVLSRIGDKWSMQVVMRLGEKSYRFNELLRAVDGISQRMLTRTLRSLERDGLVLRTVTPTKPPRVDYSLTDLGRSLHCPVVTLGKWAMQQQEAILSARAAYDQGAGSEDAA